MPNPAHTPKREFRLAGARWDPADAKAKRHGVTMSDVLRDAVDRWNEPVRVAVGDTVVLVGPDREPELCEVVEGPDGRPTLQRVET